MPKRRSIILRPHTCHLFSRRLESRHLGDVHCCIKNLHYLRGPLHEVPIDSPLPVTSTLVLALAAKIQLGLGDVDQDISALGDLCDELLNSDISMKFLTTSIVAFARAVYAHLKGPFGGQIPPKKAIGCLRKAIKHIPDLYEAAVVLAQCLLIRFHITPSDGDCKEGMDILDNIVARCDWRKKRPTPYRRMSLELAALFTEARFSTYGKPEHLEEAIYRFRAVLDGISLEDPVRPQITGYLTYHQGLRFHDSRMVGNVQDLLFSRSDSAKFLDLIAFLPELDPVISLPMTTYMKHTNALQSSAIDRLNNILEIEDGIKYCRLLLNSHPSIELAPVARSALGRLLRRAFECTNNIEYLNEAISTARGFINVRDPLVVRLPLLLDVLSFLSTRLNLLRFREDLEELMKLFPMVANYDLSGLLQQSPVSCQWASIARRFGHPTVSTAYERAMFSMRGFVTFAPTIDTQHFRLVTMSDDFKTLPLDYASYQISTGRLREAI